MSKQVNSSRLTNRLRKLGTVIELRAAKMCFKSKIIEEKWHKTSMVKVSRMVRIRKDLIQERALVLEIVEIWVALDSHSHQRPEKKDT